MNFADSSGKFGHVTWWRQSLYAYGSELELSLSVTDTLNGSKTQSSLWNYICKSDK